MISRGLQEKLEKTDFFVEADGFSRHVLWERHHADVNWVQNGSGFWSHVAGPESTCCTFMFDELDGKTVCFYEATSKVVDWGQVEDFLTPYWSAPAGRRQCNAENFHKCLMYCRRQ